MEISYNEKGTFTKLIKLFPT